MLRAFLRVPSGRDKRRNNFLIFTVVSYYHMCGILYHMLDFRSKARQQLLAYYFTNPTARHHLRDLAERLSIDPSNLSKELGRLEREGLFRSEVSGRQKYFQLNREYPLFDEVRKIVAKTIGAAPLIAQSLKRIEGIDEAYLYGSFASNQQDAASDIDVLMIGAPREEVLAQAMRKLERQLGREINYTVLTPKEFESRRARKDAFLENVWHNKRIPLIGTDEKLKVTSLTRRRSTVSSRARTRNLPRPTRFSPLTRRLAFSKPTKQRSRLRWGSCSAMGFVLEVSLGTTLPSSILWGRASTRNMPVC